MYPEIFKQINNRFIRKLVPFICLSSPSKRSYKFRFIRPGSSIFNRKDLLCKRCSSNCNKKAKRQVQLKYNLFRIWKFSDLTLISVKPYFSNNKIVAQHLTHNQSFKTSLFLYIQLRNGLVKNRKTYQFALTSFYQVFPYAFLR